MSETAKKLEAAAARSLVRKLAEVMAEVDRVPKSGRNDFHRYDYATEADIAAAVRKAMAERHLVLVPSVDKVDWGEVPTKQGPPQRLCTLTVLFTMMDGDSGESLSFTVLGQGQDAGDKASYKAMTGAEKYALLKLFLIPTGDDPEADSPERNARTEATERRPPQRAQSRTQQLAQQVRANMAPPAVPNPPGVEEVVMPFGPQKGTPLRDMASQALQGALDWAHQALEQKPNARNSGQLRQYAAQLEAELERREGAPQ